MAKADKAKQPDTTTPERPIAQQGLVQPEETQQPAGSVLFRDPAMPRQMYPDADPQQPIIRPGISYTSGTIPTTDPKTLGTALTSLHQGYTSAIAPIFRGMLQKFPHLRTVYGVRMNALTLLPWDVTANPDDPNQKLAQEKADLASKALRNITSTSNSTGGAQRGMAPIIRRLMSSLSFGFSAQTFRWEIIGGKYLPVQAEWITPERLRFAPRTNDVLVDYTGMGLWQRPRLENYLIAYAYEMEGLPQDTGLFIPSAWLFMLWAYNYKAWNVFLEKYATPPLFASVPDGTKRTAKDEINEQLEALGIDGTAVFDESVKVAPLGGDKGKSETFEVSRTGVCAECSKLYLGQTMMTENSRGGTQGVATMQNEVRLDLRSSDAGFAEDHIQQQIVAKIIGYNWDFSDENMAFLPQFSIKHKPQDDMVKKTTVYLGLQKMGLGLSKSKVATEFNAPLADPSDPEDLLTPSAAPSPAIPAPSGVESEAVMSAATPASVSNDPRVQLINAMQTALSLTHVAYLHAHFAHWNVVDPGFPQYHAFFNTIYDALHDAVDPLAEHLRALGGFPDALPGVTGQNNYRDVAAMLDQMISDNALIVQALKNAHALAEQAGELGLASFLEVRIEEHDKQRWMLTATRQTMTPPTVEQMRAGAILPMVAASAAPSKPLDAFERQVLTYADMAHPMLAPGVEKIKAKLKGAKDFTEAKHILHGMMKESKGDRDLSKLLMNTMGLWALEGHIDAAERRDYGAAKKGKTTV